MHDGHYRILTDKLHNADNCPIAYRRKLDCLSYKW